MNSIPNVNNVMRTLADPTRRAIFERIFQTKEMSVVELTRGSGVTQGAISQHLKSLKMQVSFPKDLKAATSIIAHNLKVWNR